MWWVSGRPFLLWTPKCGWVVRGECEEGYRVVDEDDRGEKRGAGVLLQHRSDVCRVLPDPLLMASIVCTQHESGFLALGVGKKTGRAHDTLGSQTVKEPQSPVSWAATSVDWDARQALIHSWVGPSSQAARS